MFKANRSKTPVYNFLNSIYYYHGIFDLRPTPGLPLTPRFACASSSSSTEYAFLRLGYDPWQRCISPFPPHAPPGAFYASDTAYTFICPAFFSQDYAPIRSQDHCPQVTDNRYSGDVDAFYRKYQMFTMLYQLVRFYLGHYALDTHTRPREAFDWNIVVRYGVAESAKNPTNYVLYSACK